MSPVLALLLRVVLLAHPPAVRVRFGDEMRRLLLRDVAAARSRLAAVLIATAGLLDIARAGLRERALPNHSPRSRQTTMDRFAQDLRYAVRALLRRPGFTVVAVLTLALGIGSTTAMFSVVNGVLLRALPFDRPDRLMRIWSTDRRDPGGPTDGSVSPVVFEDWRAQATTFEALSIYTTTRPTLTGLGEPEVIHAARVSPDFFDVLHARPRLGRTFTEEENLPSGPLAVVVSHGFWQERLGGSPEAVGSTLELNGRVHTIVGVAPEGLAFPNDARLWLAVRNDRENCGYGCVYTNAIGRLRDGVTIEQAGADLAVVSDRLSAEHPASLTNSRAALASLHDTVVGSVRSALVMLLGAVGMVLLIACANVANLLIARGATRTDEIAVRAALGAGRGRILSQLLTESLVLAAVSASFGVALAAGGVSALRALAPAGIPRIGDVGIDGAALLFAAGVALLTTLLFGLAPAARLAAGSTAGALREDAARTLGVRRGIGRSALLAAEVGLSLVLLVGAGLLLRSFAALQQLDPGYAIEDIGHFTVSLPSARYDEPAAVRFADDLERRLEAALRVPVTTSVGTPLGNNTISTSIERADRPPPEPGEGMSAGMRVVGHDFLDVMDVPLVSGRPFAPADRHEAVPVAIISERLARLIYPDEDAVGKQLRIGVSLGYDEEEPRTIVGVARDVHWDRLTGEPEPELFLPFAQVAPGFVTFLMRGGSSTLAGARAELQAIDPLLPFRDPGTMRAQVDAQTASQRFYLLLLALFAGLAITLAAVGLYGVVAYLVAQRRREIGVRIALGARRGSVVGLVLRQGLVPAVVGAATGLVLALAGARVMAGLIFGIAPRDPLTFAGTTALLLLVVVGACLVPATRASRIPPASALRAER